MMQYKFITEKMKYDGSQLHSLFGYMDHQVLGDSFIAFEGPCDIPFEHMVDGEDVLAQSPIRGGQMLHFIIEEFGKNLELAVSHQRLLATMVFEDLTHLQVKGLKREGDDIFVNEGKLSISIATVSPVSSLIHFAVNIVNEGTPVKTACLNELSISVRAFADRIAERFTQELRTINEACCKVRWVK